MTNISWAPASWSLLLQGSQCDSEKAMQIMKQQGKIQQRYVQSITHMAYDEHWSQISDKANSIIYIYFFFKYFFNQLFPIQFLYLLRNTQRQKDLFSYKTGQAQCLWFILKCSITKNNFNNFKKFYLVFIWFFSLSVTWLTSKITSPFCTNKYVLAKEFRGTKYPDFMSYTLEALLQKPGWVHTDLCFLSGSLRVKSKPALVSTVLRPTHPTNGAQCITGINSQFIPKTYIVSKWLTAKKKKKKAHTFSTGSRILTGWAHMCCFQTTISDILKYHTEILTQSTSL